jgi:hypothetical protein
MLRAGVEFTQADIMLAYDHNWYVFPTDIGMSYGDYYALVQQLRDAAATL